MVSTTITLRKPPPTQRPVPSPKIITTTLPKSPPSQAVLSPKIINTVAATKPNEESPKSEFICVIFYSCF